MRLPFARFVARATLLALLLPGTSHAQDAAHRMAEIREALRSYDPEVTSRAVEELGALAAGASGFQAREARFLRVVAAADLLLVGRLRGRDDVPPTLARAYGCAPEQLPERLRADLRTLSAEPFRETVEDALAALAPGALGPAPEPSPRHTRRDAVFFARALRRLVRSDDPVTVLAPLAEDPCAGDRARCGDPYRHFGPAGRRAIRALERLHAIMASLEATADLGDPFAAAFVREIAVDAVVLDSIPTSPRDWAPSIRSVELGEGGEPVRADAAIVVAPDHLRVGWVPQVAFEEGRARLTSGGEPLLAEAEERFPLHYDPLTYVRPVDALRAHVASRLDGARRVAVVVEPGVEAHLVSRVLRSLPDVPITTLAAVGPDGMPRGVRFVAPEETPEERRPTPVGVFVRVGGFSAWQPGLRVSLPRERTDAGWRFDFAGLDRATRRRVHHDVSVRYMANAHADLVLRAALTVAPPDRPVQLLLP